MEEPNIDIVTEDSEMNDPINTDDENTEESLNESEDYEDNLDSSLSFAQDIDLIEDDDISNDMDDGAVDDSEDSDIEPDTNDDADHTGDHLDDDSGEDDNVDEADDESGNAADEPSDNTGDLNDGDGDNADDGDDNDGENETPSESDATPRTVELNVGAVSAYGIALKNGFIGTELDWLRMFNDKISPNEKGVAGGVATLDMNGLIPTNQIPGAYDDVIDGFYDSDTDKFYKDVEKTIEVLGESGKIYVDITGAPIQYRYGGATFVRITTNEVTSMTDEDIYEILSM